VQGANKKAATMLEKAVIASIADFNQTNAGSDR
jgi:hypothetical protein